MESSSDDDVQWGCRRARRLRVGAPVPVAPAVPVALPPAAAPAAAAPVGPPAPGPVRARAKAKPRARAKPKSKPKAKPAARIGRNGSIECYIILTGLQKNTNVITRLSFQLQLSFRQ